MEKNERAALLLDGWPRLTLIIAVLLGGWLRFAPASLSGFPPNDGGMFAVAIDSIITNGFALPETVSYNQLNIPFVYPPLPFYVAAFLGKIFHIPTIVLSMWIPASVATFCIVAVYLLALSLTKDTSKAAIAALLYALLSEGAAWLVMGGGLTRSFGVFFLILTTRSAYLLFMEEKKEYGWQTALWASLTILSHPEMALHAAGVSIGLLLFSRKKENFLPATFVGMGVITLTSPWWGITFSRFGLEPFIQASKLSGRDFVWIVQQLGFLKVTGEGTFPVIGLLGLLGFGLLIVRREYLLSILIVIPYVVNQRNAALIAIVILCIAASYALTDVIIPGLQNWQRRGNKLILGFSVYVGVFVLLGAYQNVLQQSKSTVSAENREAMLWAAKNTPVTSSFLVLIGNEHLFYDPTMEWFPVFAARRSIGTIQGKEWQYGNVFYAEMGKFQEIQRCYFEDVACLESKTKTAAPYDYLYLSKTCVGQINCTIPAGKDGPLALSLRSTSEKYQVVFENNDVTIFAVK